MKIICEIPIKTISELNCTEHWTKKSKRHKQQKFFTQLALKEEVKKITLPCVIKIIRISPRVLDYDNLVSSQKWVVDSICDLLIPGLKPGRADGDKRISVLYDQEVGKLQAIRVEIES
jgi:hypothetical protein